jgi:hypothetical protein
MTKDSSGDKIFTKEFILEIILKLLGFFFVVGIVLVMLLIGLSIGEVSLNFGPLAIRFSTPEPGAESASTGKTLYSDDFSNPKSGWSRLREADGITDYENGAYRIWINTIGESGNGMDYFSWPQLESELPSDVQIEVDAAKAGGPDDNDFGVMCRYTSINEKDTYYRFMVSSDGYAGIMLVEGDESTVISSDKLQPSDAIKQGKASNHIRADCIGDQLTLYVNGKKVADAQNSTLIGGEVGLIAGTYTIPGTDIHFDNFLVKQP